MRTISFHEEAFEEYNSWALTDKKTFIRLKRLITEAARDPFDGIGKPEGKFDRLLVETAYGRTSDRLQGHRNQHFYS